MKVERTLSALSEGHKRKEQKPFSPSSPFHLLCSFSLLHWICYFNLKNPAIVEPSTDVIFASQHVPICPVGVFQFAMNCPEMLSYLNEVLPVLVISTSSVNAVLTLLQLIFFWVKDEISDVPVFSIEPANTSNFIGTVCPPFMVLRTLHISTG